MSFDRSLSAGYMTNWAARLFARAIDRKLRAAGLSSGQLPVFFALGNGEALPQKALARAAAIEQPTMAATLSRMERDGLIERRPDPEDRRSALISLTPAAMEKVQAVREAIASVNAAALADLGEAERNAYLAALRTIIAALDALPDNGDAKTE
ncbi:MarR family winged helix-turn-helix transcriptional regulator [Pseudochelatococcus sp. B33]